jgi:hypothetical protein
MNTSHTYIDFDNQRVCIFLFFLAVISLILYDNIFQNNILSGIGGGFGLGKYGRCILRFCKIGCGVLYGIFILIDFNMLYIIYYLSFSILIVHFCKFFPQLF